ncbi:serine/threonine-protein kinase [Nocardia sp. NPDC059177]|uniref:serine/threonine-protein kinase n=1 Tax=Nocardia sp. NPDC059177 TaxID=3346759 RepID=UPI0036807E1A
MATLTRGAVIAGYRVERRIGGGNMGEVYLAGHPRLPRADAIKVLARHRLGNAMAHARFLREAELAGRIQHPNVVTVYDCGVDGGTPWLAMQFIAGVDAAELLRRTPGGLAPGAAVDIVEGAARGLDEAHRMGLLHRDVKPANLLLAAGETGPGQVRITDFGIARALDDTSTLTAANAVLATIAYAAPEQAGATVSDHRADVYSLGCSLYELLTGALPYPRAGVGAIVHAHLSAPPPRPSKLNPTVPKALDGVVARALAKNPDDRYPSCGHLATAARNALHGRTEPARRCARRARRVATAAVALPLGVIVAGAGFLALRNDSGSAAGAPAPPPAPPWGEFQQVVNTFPDLLPTTPATTGPRGLRCSTKVRSNAALDERMLNCIEPHEANVGGDLILVVTCNYDGFIYPPPAPETGFEIESWSRRSGSGTVGWKNDEGGSGGRLQVQFDGAPRESCSLVVGGGIPGREIYERWWPDAPI